MGLKSILSKLITGVSILGASQFPSYAHVSNNASLQLKPLSQKDYTFSPQELEKIQQEAAIMTFFKTGNLMQLDKHRLFLESEIQKDIYDKAGKRELEILLEVLKKEMGIRFGYFPDKSDQIPSSQKKNQSHQGNKK